MPRSDVIYALDRSGRALNISVEGGGNKGYFYPLFAKKYVVVRLLG